MVAYPWFEFSAALAIGLLIGVERERSKGEGPNRRPAGIRTFMLATLLGAIASYVGGTLLLAIAVTIVGALAGLAYGRTHNEDPGLTTSIGLPSRRILASIGATWVGAFISAATLT